jgi:E3 ubiquitin-protein ligase TRIP12
VQALQKVSLKNWSLGYMVDIDAQCSAEDDPMAASPESGADMEVDSPTKPVSMSSPVRIAGTSPPRHSGLPAKKRRRTQSADVADEVAREMYSCFMADAPSDGSGITGPHQLIARCGDSEAVTDAIELLHLLKAQGPSLGVEANLWVSSKLDRKLRIYQLEDPLSVVSGTLPLWATILPRLCPFLFSLKTRKMLLKYTAFGPSFAVHWTQESKVGSFLRRRATVQTELNAQMDPRKIQELSQELSNIEEHVVKSNYWLGTLQSTLVRMTKGDDLLRQSDIAMELVHNASRLVEVQFDGETGFGSAVTQSFYVEVAQMLQDRNTNRQIPMWLEDDDSNNSQYLLCRRGLVIRPLVDGPQRLAAVRRFRFLGRLMGQALREGFIVPLPLAEEFFGLMLGEQLGPANFPHPGSGSAGELCGVLADFAAELASTAGQMVEAGRTPEEVQAWRKEQGERDDFGDRFLHHAEGTPTQRLSFDQYAQMVGLCFVETGLSGAPLCTDGDNVPVTVDNVENFVEIASRFWFDTGVTAQIEAFRAGLNDVFPFECLVAFSRSELREMFCGEDRIEWDEQALLSHLHPVGGLSDKSPTYKYLVAELLEMSQAERARFLDFVSSCPRLPPGGIAKFHVDVFPDSTSKQGYPRSRACANQLYLPPYASKEELHEKLHEAMHSSAGHHEQRMRDM